MAPIIHKEDEIITIKELLNDLKQVYDRITDSSWKSTMRVTRKGNTIIDFQMTISSQSNEQILVDDNGILIRR